MCTSGERKLRRRRETLLSGAQEQDKRVNTRQNTFQSRTQENTSVRVVKCWNKLPREAVEYPSGSTKSTPGLGPGPSAWTDLA